MSESQPKGVEEFRRILLENKKIYEKVMDSAIQIANHALARMEIEHLPILSRLKTIDSACNKFQQKGYQNPIGEMTDIIGLRIVLFLNTDLDRCSEVLRSVFEVDDSLSTDKRKLLKSNEFGYQSLHLVCSLGSKRSSLPEYTDLCGIPIEIQIRTALQHTWAEIEHKRGYKGTLSLPPELKRRLNAASAALELVDRELSEVARLAEEYKRAVQLKELSVSDDALSVVALEEILKSALKRSNQDTELKNLPNKVADFIVNELRCFGITTVQDAQSLVDLDTSRKLFERRKLTTSEPVGVTFYRALMLFANAEKFLPCTNGKLKIVAQSLYQEYEEITGKSGLDELLAEHGVTVSTEMV